MYLPPLPSWNALHPLIIHFPIALLLVAPLFIGVGAVLRPEKGRTFLFAALALILLGTVALFVAVETGEAAGKLAERAGTVDQVLETHEALAEKTQVIFSVLSVLFSVVVLTPVLLKKPPTRLATTALPILFLAIYGVGALFLVNTAHNGGRLVHEFGVRAAVSKGASGTAVSMQSAAQESEE